MWCNMVIVEEKDAQYEAQDVLPVEDETDLTATRPGERLADEAVALRRAAPTRAFLARVLGVHTDERARRIGADGERQVAARLNKLGTQWYVLHSIVLNAAGTDLDHLVIGPGGVYCINTKNHPGKKVWVAGNTFMVSGQKHTYIAASRSEAKKVSRILTKACAFPVAVSPIIVVANGDLNVKRQPDDVRIASRRRVSRWLRERPHYLSDEEVDTIFAIARQPSTWDSRAKR
jgi:hypothetical protein